MNEDAPVTNLREETTRWGNIEVCHIDDGSGKRALCGDRSAAGPVTCAEWGSAICPTCGNPMCPTCAKLASLDYALEADVG